ncbi:MAG: hypothetical protein LH615_11470 [Ferruginibacter sp.]|nr:hypothetical protein [Ferruginibacter sp.]
MNRYIIMSDILYIENIWKRRFEYCCDLEINGSKALTGKPMQEEKKMPITSQKADDCTSISVGLFFIKSLK